MAKPARDLIRQQAYLVVFGTEEGLIVLNDMVQFSEQAQDPTVRVGRSDMLLHILRQRARATEKQEEAEDV